MLPFTPMVNFWTSFSTLSFLLFGFITASIVIILISSCYEIILGLLIIEMICLTALGFSFGQEVVNYGFLIIYGGGVLVLYLIFLQFHPMSNYLFRGSIIIKLKTFCWILLISLSLITFLILTWPNFIFLKCKEPLFLFSFLNYFNTKVYGGCLYSADNLNVLFLDSSSYLLILIGFFLCITILWVVAFLRKK